MKSNNFFVLGLGMLSLISCTKESDVASTTDSNSMDNSTFTSIVTFSSEEEYQEKMSSQSAYFAAFDHQLSLKPSDAIAQYPLFTEEEITNETYDKEVLKEASAAYLQEYIQNEVDRYEGFVAEFPKYKHFNSAYKLYIDILKTNDLPTWKKAVVDYPELMTLLNNSLLIPLHIDEINANINLDERYVIGNKTIVHERGAVKQITNENTAEEEVTYLTAPASGSRDYIPITSNYLDYAGFRIGGAMHYERLAYYCVGSYPHLYKAKNVVACWLNGYYYAINAIELTDYYDVTAPTDPAPAYKIVYNKTNNQLTNQFCYSSILSRNLKVRFKITNASSWKTYWFYTNGYF